MGAVRYVRTSRLQFTHRWFAPMALACFGLLLLAEAGAATAFSAQIWPTALPLAVLLAGALAVFGFRTSVGEARVDKTGLRWNGRLLLDELSEGDHVTRPSGSYVRLRGRQGEATLSVDDHAEAEKLLAAAGLDLNRTRTYHLKQTNTHFGTALGVIFVAFFSAIVLATLLPHVGVPIAAAFVVATVAGAMWYLRRDQVTLVVGDDGLALREGPRKARFIPYTELESVTLTFDSGLADGLILRLKDGTTRTLSMPSPANAVIPEEPARPVVARIQRAQKASSGVHAEQGAVSTVLAQGGRSTPEWVESLRGALAETASYRTMPVSREDLEAVLHDGTAQKKTRLAAAIALGAAGRGKRGANAVRDAANACAAEDLATKLRIATEDGVEPARLAEALDQLEEEDEEPEATEASRSGSSSA